MCLELWLIERNASAKAPRGDLTVCWGELGGEDHVVVGVQGADFLQGTGFFGQAVDQLTAVRVEPQQADAEAVRGRDHASVGAEAQLLDVTPAHVGFLDAVRQSQGTARRDGAHGGSFLEFIDTSPLKGEAERGTLKGNPSTANAPSLPRRTGDTGTTDAIADRPNECPPWDTEHGTAHGHLCSEPSEQNDPPAPKLLF